MKKRMFFLAITSILLFMAFNNVIVAQDVEHESQQVDESFIRPVRAKVIEVQDQSSNDVEYSGGTLSVQTQYVKVQVLQGKYKSKELTAEHSLNMYLSDREGVSLRKGDHVLIYIEEDEYGDPARTYVSDLARDRYLAYIAALFIALLLVIGRQKGVKTVISLVITLAAVVKILLPLIFKGVNPVAISIIVCCGIIVVVLVIVNGFSVKTLSACIGTSIGVFLAGGLALLVGSLARLTGMSNEETQMLLYIPQNIQFDFRGLLFAGIIIGSLGAVMDVGMSIASSVHEIKEADPECSYSRLFKSGMNVGRDIMGTMSNTLILAYTGGALNLLLIFIAYDIPFMEVVNSDYMAAEVLRALAGSIGIILTIPVTAFIASKLEERFF